MTHSKESPSPSESAAYVEPGFSEQPASEIRRRVSETYSKALSQPAPAGASCCAASPVEENDPHSIPRASASALAGYRSAELGTLPEDAVENSFGCGNPVAYAEVQQGQSVLDLGSGAGIDLLLAAERVGPSGQVIGVDMTEAMIERARANIAESGHRNVEVRHGLIEDLPVADGSVDWVISNCVLNLSPDKPKVFEEIARVLKPGGQISISDIVAQDLPDWLRNTPAAYSGCIAGAIDETSYLAGLEAAGLEEIQVVDRLVYDASQLEAFATSGEAGDINGLLRELDLDRDSVRQLAQCVEGKVWSVKIKARKSPS